MQHCVYEITNIVNGKIYVGKHSTEDLNDGYMGSGNLISKAIAKYGLENFRKRIVQVFDSAEEALIHERLLVDEQFVSRVDTYNLNLGGEGSWHAANSNVELRLAKNRRAAASMNQTVWSDPDFRLRRSQSMRAQNIKLREEGKLKRPDWTGKRHSEESKRAIGRANSLRQQGEKNSQFGTVWIFHDEQRSTMRILRNELDKYLEQGWSIGRKMKW